jgi:hypothetical protein
LLADPTPARISGRVVDEQYEIAYVPVADFVTEEEVGKLGSGDAASAQAFSHSWVSEGIIPCLNLEKSPSSRMSRFLLNVLP